LINKMTATEKAWAAGLFEGEGCVYVHNCNQKTASGSRRYTYARAVISSTDLDVLKRWQRTVGVGQIYKRNGLKNPRCKQEYQLSFQGYEDIAQLAKAFGPWLGKRRRSQFQIVLRNAKSGRVGVVR
jgi:hypothetical protein